jgi:hypothetical protein
MGSLIQKNSALVRAENGLLEPLRGLARPNRRFSPKLFRFKRVCRGGGVARGILAYLRSEFGSFRQMVTGGASAI